MENQIQILIADDHPIMRQGLRQVIESDADLKVIAEAADGLETLLKIREHQPQVAVIDIDMPKMDGFQIALGVRQEKIDVAIIFLTVHREESFMKKALDLGVKGFVLKDSSVTDIVTAIKAAHQGQSFVSPAMMSYLIKPQLSKSKEGLESLTPSERSVLKLIARYKTTKEIAELLFVSRRTIESHRLNICQKLHLRGSHSLIKFALEHLPEIEQN
jgi:two-component system, NarL family, response regulator DegU